MTVIYLKLLLVIYVTNLYCQKLSLFTRDVNKELTPKDQDKDKDLTSKDQDKDLKYVLKESLRTRTNITVQMTYMLIAK